MKVLLSAFACAPGHGSEPGIGWNVVSQVAARHECWVLTHPSSRQYIEDRLSWAPLSGARFQYVDVPDGLPSRVRTRLHYLYYLSWQREALRAARRLHREVRFDLVHHVTYGSCWMPSFMGRLGIPFVWFAGACETTPASFVLQMGWRAAAAEITRNAIVGGFGRISRRITTSQSTLILAVGAFSGARTNVSRFLPAGLEVWESEALASIPVRKELPVRIASIGRLLGWKGFDLGLRAFDRFRRGFPRSEYWIIGDGPERRRLERLARRLGCAEQTRFLGWLSRTSSFEALQHVDVLMHPSLHEQLGYVVLEAMAGGKPVVCLDRGGPARLVGTDAGVLVPVRRPKQVVADLARALTQLAGNEQDRGLRGERARERVETLWTWDRVGAELDSVYAVVTGNTNR